MSVKENLMMGDYLVREKSRKHLLFEKALTLFPRLSERLKQPAGTLSGGERKMLAIARGLMPDPKMMQNIHLTLQIVDRGYVLEDGMIAAEGSARELLASEDIQRAYLGITAVNLKHHG
jgi:branched-chain amino acid transport system ATP-binding protein